MTPGDSQHSQMNGQEHFAIPNMDGIPTRWQMHTEIIRLQEHMRFAEINMGKMYKKIGDQGRLIKDLEDKTRSLEATIGPLKRAFWIILSAAIVVMTTAALGKISISW